MMKKLLALTISTVLYGCGGGSDSSSPITEVVTSSPVVETQSPAQISGVDTGAVVDSANELVSGVLSITDEQTDEASFQAQTDVAVSFGSFSINTLGEWSYTLTSNNASVSALAANEKIDVEVTVASVDNTPHVITITVNGINNAAEFDGNNSNTVNADVTAPITGTVTVTDLDNGEGTIVAQTDTPVTYGLFSINESGDWSYILDTNNNAVINLVEDATLNDTASISSDDGSTTDIEITIVGVASDSEGSFIAQSEVILDSDGVNSGLSAYTLIENAFADGSIEAPDFYSTNHTDVEHIVEDEDDVVGPHFVFLAHRDSDHDRGGDPSDRQRNEIKTYDQSDETLRGYLDDTFQYSWKFKVSSDMELSSRFSHFFQIKPRNYSDDNTNGNDGQPLITISGAERNSTGNELQVRYSSGFNVETNSTTDVHLATVEWSLITDQWLEVFVQVTYAEEGKLKMTINRMSDGLSIVDIDEQNIDTWRGFVERDFSRPKWGIYRSILETESLREDEEKVRFANFVVKKGVLSE